MKEKGEKMIYPKKLFQGTTSGITAPSDGIVDSIKQKRLEHAKQMFQKKGYNILETSHVRHSEKGKSAESLIQAKELESLFQNSQVNYIIAAAGGDFLLEILPYINWNVIKENPKWLQGYSDITFLLFILTAQFSVIMFPSILISSKTIPEPIFPLIQRRLISLSGILISTEQEKPEWSS